MSRYFTPTTDDGTGIPFNKLIELFKLFHLFDENRDRDTGGIGPGLAIVKLIADKLDLKIIVERSALGGARLAVLTCA